MIWVWSGGLSGHRGTNIKLEDKCKTFRVLINLPSYNSNRSDAWTGLYGQECNYYIIHKSWWVNRIAKCSCDRITTTSAGSFTISEVHGFEAFVLNTIFETHTGRLIRGATLQVQRGQLCCTSGKSNNPSTNAMNSQGQDTVSQQQPILNISLSLSCLQEIFPVYFGSKYEAALEMLVWEFISRLDELLPVPDFTQVPRFFEI